MTLLSDVWYVAYRELIKFFRARVRLIMTVIQPVIWLGLMGNMMQGLTQNPMAAGMFGTESYLAFMTPGIILMTVLFGGVFAGMSIVWDRRIGYLEKLMASPISRAAIPFGKMLAAAIQSGIQVVIIVCIAYALGVRFAAGLGGVVVILAIAMCFSLILSGLSLALAATIKVQETLMAIVNFLTMPLMFTSNALFPKEAMPSWLAAIASINPVSHAVAPLRELTISGWDWAGMAPSLGVVVGLAIAFMAVAHFAFHRATVE